MIREFGKFSLLLVVVLAVAGLSLADDTKGMQVGKPPIKSAGPLCFGPEGLMFLADPMEAKIYAIDTKDNSVASAEQAVNVEAINEKIAGLLGTEAAQVQIVDLAVNPASGAIYLSCARGRGPDAMPVIVRVDRLSKLALFSLDKVPFSGVALTNAPANDPQGRRGNPRMESITDLGFINGRLVVAGLSNEEFASKLRSIPFPFKEVDPGTSVEIYHGSHGAFETRSPIRTFTSYKIGQEPHILAAYTCTPLVKFPIEQLKPGIKVQGKTVAELGNRNRPLDMFVYRKDGKDFILMANSARGVMKVSTEDIDSIEPITSRVADTKGLKYETLADWQGVMQLDRLDENNAIVLVKPGDPNQPGPQHLKTMPLP
jgi:hypothetical protein